MRGRRWLFLVIVGAVAALLIAACDSSDDEERLAAQRFFRNYLVQQNSTAAADVRIQGFICSATEEPSGSCDADAALPPDFPLFDDLTLLGSAFTDTEMTRELIVGWESRSSADTLLEFYREELAEEPWSIEQNRRVIGIDFIQFVDADDTTFAGELRIAQEGDAAVLILIARQIITPADGSSS